MQPDRLDHQLFSMLLCEENCTLFVFGGFSKLIFNVSDVEVGLLQGILIDKILYMKYFIVYILAA